MYSKYFVHSLGKVYWTEYKAHTAAIRGHSWPLVPVRDLKSRLRHRVTNTMRACMATFILLQSSLSFLSLHFFTLFKKRYGEITQEAARYPLFVIKSKGWDAAAKPSVLVTGGTHGYETSGVQGALLFAEKEMVTTFSSSHPYFCLAYSNVILFYLLGWPRASRAWTL